LIAAQCLISGAESRVTFDFDNDKAPIWQRGAFADATMSLYAGDLAKGKTGSVSP
jgi:hypothetical protein